MKKIVSLVLALMMVMSMASTAFAGTFEDVTNADNAKAVDALAALGIIDGYEDGTFRPERIVTRAEMAKMMIVALGYESIASDTPAFSDSQDHWAKGFIALAADLGIVQGRGNGIFDPDATVTYQEAAVMMLRTLGFTDQSINGGKSDVYNAGNYKTKALALGLFSNLSTFSFNNGANRGDIAVMLFNNLTNVLVEVNPTTGLAQPVTPNVTLISKLATRVEDFEVTADKLGKHTADLTNYLYETVVAYTVDGDVVYVEKSNNSSVTGNMTVNTTDDTVTVNKVTYGYNTTTGGNVDAKIMVNGEEVTLTPSDLENIESDNIVKVVYNKANKSIIALVIEEINETIQIEKNDLYVEGRIDFTGAYYKLPIDDNGKFDASALTIVGVDTLADIAVNDVVQLALDSSDTIYKMYVTRESVDGKIAKIDADKNVYINGVAYKTTLTLALGNEGTFFLNKDNVVVFFSPKSDTVATTKHYGVILGAKEGVTSNDFGSYTINSLPQVKVANLNGTVKTYDVLVKADAEGTLTTPAGFTTTKVTNGIKLEATAGTAMTAGGKIVEYTLNAAGQITGIYDVTFDGTDTLKVTDAKFQALTNSSTQIVTYNTSASKFVTYTKEEIGSTDIDFQYVGTTAWSLVIVSTSIEPAKENTYAMIVSVSDVLNSDDKEVAELVVLINGVTKTLYTNDTLNSGDFEVNELVKLTLDTKNIVTDVDSAEYVGTTSEDETAIAITKNVITLSGPEYIALASDVVVYTVNDKGVAVNSSITAVDREIAISTPKQATVTLYDDNGDDVVDVIVLK